MGNLRCTDPITSNFQILSVLLITSKSSQQKWIIPGGGINPNETAENAVLREAYEEAGVICDNAKYLGFVQVTRNYES